MFFTAAPASVVIKDAVVEDDQITLKWDKPNENGAAITYYAIYRKTGSDEEWTKVKNLTDISNLVYVGKVDKGMTYKFVVTAGNKHGQSGKDNVKEVKVPSGRLSVIFVINFFVSLFVVLLIVMMVMMMTTTATATTTTMMMMMMMSLFASIYR